MSLLGLRAGLLAGLLMGCDDCAALGGYGLRIDVLTEPADGGFVDAGEWPLREVTGPYGSAWVARTAGGEVTIHFNAIFAGVYTAALGPLRLRGAQGFVQQRMLGTCYEEREALMDLRPPSATVDAGVAATWALGELPSQPVEGGGTSGPTVAARHCLPAPLGTRLHAFRVRDPSCVGTFVAPASDCDAVAATVVRGVDERLGCFVDLYLTVSGRRCLHEIAVLDTPGRAAVEWPVDCEHVAAPREITLVRP